MAAADTETDARRVLHRATYAFRDPHLGFGPYDETDLNIFPTSGDLVVDEDFHIVDVRTGSVAAGAGLRPGWRLVSVEGEPIRDAARQVYVGLVDDPSAAQLAYAATLLANGRRTGERTLEFLTPLGESLTLTLGNIEVGRSILGHFIREPAPYQVHEKPSLEREFTVPRRWVEYVLPRAPYFDPDSTVVLGGHWTRSMGEGLGLVLTNGVDFDRIERVLG